MTEISNEKRDYARMKIFCEIQCKSKKEKENYQGWSVSLSGSGLSFLSTHQFIVGDDVKITVPATKSNDKAIIFTVKVVRNPRQENNFFEMGATFHKMKDNDFITLSYRVNG